MPDIPVPGSRGPLRAYRSDPLHPGPWPGVVLVHDAFGMTDDLRQAADRLATAGYLAVAPDFLSWGAKPRCLVSTFRDLQHGHGRAFDDIEAVRSWLAGLPECTGRVGVLGFCMGGGFALQAAALSPFQAASVNYGLPPRDLEPLAHSCPVVGSFGARDPAVKPAAVEAVTRRYAEAGVPHDVKIYPDAGHSFMNRYNVGPYGLVQRVAGMHYHHPSAQDAWRRILAFFDEHLAPPVPAAGSGSGDAGGSGGEGGGAG